MSAKLVDNTFMCCFGVMFSHKVPSASSRSPRRPHCSSSPLLLGLLRCDLLLRCLRERRRHYGLAVPALGSITRHVWFTRRGSSHRDFQRNGSEGQNARQNRRRDGGTDGNQPEYTSSRHPFCSGETKLTSQKSAYILKFKKRLILYTTEKRKKKKCW